MLTFCVKYVSINIWFETKGGYNDTYDSNPNVK